MENTGHLGDSQSEPTNQASEARTFTLQQIKDAFSDDNAVAWRWGERRPMMRTSEVGFNLPESAAEVVITWKERLFSADIVIDTLLNGEHDTGQVLPTMLPINGTQHAD